MTRSRVLRRLTARLMGGKPVERRAAAMPAGADEIASPSRADWVTPEIEPAMCEYSGLSVTPDWLERSAGQFRVIDLKSGVNQSEITEPQRRQLLLYAALVKSQYGQLPTEVVIEDAAGRTHVMPVVATEVDQELSQAVELVAEFNRAALTGPREVESLARPSPDACGHCPQKVACRPYWTNLQSNWLHGAVLGTILDVTARGSSVAVELEIHSPVDWAGTRGSVYGLLARPADSGCLAAVGTDLAPGDRAYRARWDTTVRSYYGVKDWDLGSGRPHRQFLSVEGPSGVGDLTPPAASSGTGLKNQRRDSRSTSGSSTPSLPNCWPRFTIAVLATSGLRSATQKWTPPSTSTN